MAGQIPGSDGRRLRLQRRKAGLSMEELAELLGTDKAGLSDMENNRESLTTAARAFLADPPQRVPAPGTATRKRPAGGKAAAGGGGSADPPPPPDEPLPVVEEEQQGPGPRPTSTDSAPRPRAKIEALPRQSDIDDLEVALRTLLAGESFLIPREQPDGTVLQVEAVLPGLAQGVGMYDEFDGEIIRIYAPGIAHAWAELARTNSTVRKVLFGLTYGGAYRGVIAASLPPLMAIAVHHGAFGLGRERAPETVYEHPQPDPTAGFQSDTGPWEPVFTDNGDGTWTDPNGQVGRWGPSGFMTLEEIDAAAAAAAAQA